MTGDLPLLGFGLPVSGPWATPATISHIARRAEARGYASLWTLQRVLSPVSGEHGPPHESVLDPVVPPAFVAGHSGRIRLGTSTICAPFVGPATAHSSGIHPDPMPTLSRPAESCSIVASSVANTPGAWNGVLVMLISIRTCFVLAASHWRSGQP